MWQAVEIFLKDGRSYLFNLFDSDYNKNFLNILSVISHILNTSLPFTILSYWSKKSMNKELHFTIIESSRKYFELQEYTKKWVKREISNFDYLCLLNKYSSRSSLFSNDGWSCIISNKSLILLKILFASSNLCVWSLIKLYVNGGTLIR